MLSKERKNIMNNTNNNVNSTFAKTQKKISNRREAFGGTVHRKGDWC